MTSPPRRPILSLKFKTPVAGEPKPTVAAAPQPTLPIKKPRPAAKPQAVPKPVAVAVAKAKPAAKPAPAAKPPTSAKSGPAISPDLFKAAVKAATSAIVSVVADPEWKSQELLDRYQAAKEHATSTHRQQAKLVSTVATRRHATDIAQADVQNAAMRAAYAAALVALVGPPGAAAET